MFSIVLLPVLVAVMCSELLRLHGGYMAACDVANLDMVLGHMCGARMPRMAEEAACRPKASQRTAKKILFHADVVFPLFFCCQQRDT